MRQRFNIGLVGHVMNGKTTLVQKLSGTDTKRHSAEMKSGRTVQLGYANANLWCCNSCGDQSCVPTKWSSKSCVYCGNECILSYRLSFCDLPGHQSYINTMIKGSSVLDAAIVVTDVTQPPQQIQTLEHLAILEVMNIRHVVVVQNKCDLTLAAQCHKHLEQLREQLIGTVAEHAPVIPICAQRGINVDAVVHALFQMCQTLATEVKVPDSPFTGFSIIRSFDINKPMTDLDQIAGGVFGGCMFGSGQLQVGDRIVIRPGLKHYPDLETVIQSIQTDKDKVPSISLGGLFACGTNLDPQCTKSDRLVGQLAGRPDQLPPVIQSVSLTVQFVQLTASEHAVRKTLVQDQSYTFIWGNLVIQGQVKSKQSRVYCIQFEHPICIYLNKCLIYEPLSPIMVGVGQVKA